MPLDLVTAWDNSYHGHLAKINIIRVCQRKQEVWTWSWLYLFCPEVLITELHEGMQSPSLSANPADRMAFLHLACLLPTQPLCPCHPPLPLHTLTSEGIRCCTCCLGSHEMAELVHAVLLLSLGREASSRGGLQNVNFKLIFSWDQGFHSVIKWSLLFGYYRCCIFLSLFSFKICQTWMKVIYLYWVWVSFFKAT